MSIREQMKALADSNSSWKKNRDMLLSDIEDTAKCGGYTYYINENRVSGMINSTYSEFKEWLTDVCEFSIEENDNCGGVNIIQISWS